MSKSKTRKRILNLRQNKHKSDCKINFSNLINILQERKINKGVIGGYYTVNYEIDDLNILEKLKQKNIKFLYP